MLTSQLRLMAVLAGLVVLCVLVAGFVAERSLRSDQIDRVEASLSERAALVLDQVEPLGLRSENRRTLDEVADRAGRSGRMRVTILGPTGEVLGDSSVAFERLETIENHADRPEVSSAISGSRGVATRRSETVGHELLYVALPAREGGVVRVAVELAELEAARTKVRERLALAGLLGLLLSFGLSYLVARSALRPIREVRVSAEAIARGDLDERPPIYASDELGEISNAIREIARQLRSRLEEATGEKEQLRAVLGSMVEGVLVVDEKGTIVIANARLRALFDIYEEVEGRPFLAAIRHPDLDDLFREVEVTSGIVVRTLELGDPKRTLRIQAVRFSRGPMQKSGSVAVFHDISELERLEEVRRDFVQNASHELRTPLTAIQGFAETLLSNDLDTEKRRSYLEIIDRHARRLGDLVNDLLSLTTAETGRIHLDPVELDVAEVVRRTIRDLEPRWKAAELTIQCKVEGDSQALADPQALVQILTNLLDNAIKYTDANGEVVVRVTGKPGRVHVAVCDTGIGIPDQDRARVFERFYRVDRARSRALGGTGLGLSIVRHLVQALGGDISVESEPGKGSQFSFSLPRVGRGSAASAERR